MADLFAVLTRKWHDAINSEVLQECDPDSPMGGEIRALCAAADLLLDLCKESIPRARIVRAVADEVEEKYFA